MSYRMIYMTDFQRTISGIIIDSQYSIPVISNQVGAIIKQYVDGEINKVVANVIPYKIETENGNLAGYFTLQTDGQFAILLQKQLRPAFQQFDGEISAEITTFIQQNGWKNDFLV